MSDEAVIVQDIGFLYLGGKIEVALSPGPSSFQCYTQKSGYMYRKLGGPGDKAKIKVCNAAKLMLKITIT